MSLLEEIADPLSSAGYRVVHRFGSGIPDGCSIPLSLKSEEQMREMMRKASIKKAEEEEIRRKCGQWSRRSVIASWIYKEAEQLEELRSKEKKRNHHHHLNAKSLLQSVRKGLHLHHRKNFKPKVPAELLETHHEGRFDRETSSLASSSLSNFSVASV